MAWETEVLKTSTTKNVSWVNVTLRCNYPSNKQTWQNRQRHAWHESYQWAGRTGSTWWTCITRVTSEQEEQEAHDKRVSRELPVSRKNRKHMMNVYHESYRWEGRTGSTWWTCITRVTGEQEEQEAHDKRVSRELPVRRKNRKHMINVYHESYRWEGRTGSTWWMCIQSRGTCWRILQSRAWSHRSGCSRWRSRWPWIHSSWMIATTSDSSNNNTRLITHMIALLL